MSVTASDDGEIRTLLARLAQLADSGDLDEYLTLFAPDAEWVIPEIPQTGVPASVRRGVEEIAAGVRERRAAGVQGPGSDTAHLVGTIAVRFEDGDTAIADSTWMFLGQASTAPAIRTFGRYHDTLRRVDGAWRLARREIHLGS